MLIPGRRRDQPYYFFFLKPGRGIILIAEVGCAPAQSARTRRYQPAISIGGWPVRTIFAGQHRVVLQEEEQPNYRKREPYQDTKSSRQGKGSSESPSRDKWR
jgi:hypothetical protein